MLVLSRKPDDSYIQIEVPPSTEMQIIKVNVDRLDRSKAYLGFDCHRSIEIFRSELLETAKEPVR